jgi:hypothetical protein
MPGAASFAVVASSCEPPRVDLDALDPRYGAVLTTTESFLVSYPANWSALDLAPLGVSVPEARRYTATSLRSRDVVDGLLQLDAVTFGDQQMLMPRWVLFDCGAFPGVVYGFGRRAGDLPAAVRAHYRVLDDDDAFVPLSMWVGVRCAEDGAWFGHNLSSANRLLDGAARLPGLATLTKVLGVTLARARVQYGATQWDSDSLELHLRLGDMHLLSAYTPAHTHPETFSYRIDVDQARLRACLEAGWRGPEIEGERVLDAGDAAGIRALHREIEEGARYRLVRAERAAGGRRRLLHLCRSPAA